MPAHAAQTESTHKVGRILHAQGYPGIQSGIQMSGSGCQTLHSTPASCKSFVNTRTYPFAYILCF